VSGGEISLRPPFLLRAVLCRRRAANGGIKKKRRDRAGVAETATETQERGREKEVQSVLAIRATADQTDPRFESRDWGRRVG